MNKRLLTKNKNKESTQAFDPSENVKVENVPHQNKYKSSIWWLTLFCLALTISTSFIVTSYQDEGIPEQVVANRISTSTTAGEALFDEEVNANITASDFEVTNMGSDGGEARMLIWDFNSEDFDEVKILVDGVPVKERLILANNAAAINIPVPSTITIQGVTDNGGGISYAVKFPTNKKTFFNIVNKGKANTYTVLPTP